MRIQRVTLTLALFAVALPLAAQTENDKDDEAVIMVAEEDSCAYRVEDGESLGEAMTREALAQRDGEEEKGVCVQEELEHKPEDAVACKCYELSKCNGTEAPTCKRHCRRDLCKCCSI